MNPRHCILIVDDEPEVTTMFAKYLEKRGYEVKTAPNALEAVRTCHKGGIDLIITDYQMPEITGVELLREVRKTWPNIPVVLMSGQADMHTALAALREHAFDFLSKPIDSNILIETIGLALAQANPEPATPATGPLIGPIGHTRPSGHSNVSILEMNRPLDANSERNFAPMIRRLLTERDLQKHIVVNFKNVPYINNMGLNYLLDMFDQLKATASDVFFTGFQEPVYRYLKTLGYLDFFPYVSSLEKALTNIPTR